MSAQPRNAQLKSAIRTWLPVALRLIEEQITKHPRVSNDQTIRSQGLLLAVVRPGSRVRGLSETNALFGAMSKIPGFANDALTSMHSGAAQIDFTSIPASLKLGRFLLAYLGRNLDWSFDSRRFDRAYADLEAVLYDLPSILVRARLEVWHINSNRRAVAVAPNVTLRRLTAAERDEWKRFALENERFGPGDRDPPLPGMFLEITHPASDLADGSSDEHMDVRFRLSEQASGGGHSLLQGLRLLAFEDVAIGLLTLDSPNQLFPADLIQLSGERPVSGRRTASAWGSAEFPFFASPPYTLTRARARQLVDVWPYLAITYADRRLDLAFRRFETSYDRNSPDDQLLDYWIALEALFLNETQELAYRAGLRIAQFIGATTAERQDIFKEIKRSYSCRSKVIHGEDYPEEAKKKLSLKTAEFLRRALRACLPAGKAPEISALDRRLLR